MPRPSPAEAQGTPWRRVRSSTRPPGGGASALVTWVVLGRHLAGGEEEPRGTVPQSSPASPGLRVTAALTRVRLGILPAGEHSHPRSIGGARSRNSWVVLQQVGNEINPPLPPAASGVTAWEQQDPRKCLQGHNMP